jgi:hypothetical protein
MNCTFSFRDKLTELVVGKDKSSSRDLVPLGRVLLNSVIFVGRELLFDNFSSLVELLLLLLIFKLLLSKTPGQPLGYTFSIFFPSGRNSLNDCKRKGYPLKIGNTFWSKTSSFSLFVSFLKLLFYIIGILKENFDYYLLCVIFVEYV